jgi:hypothetical protein
VAVLLGSLEGVQDLVVHQKYFWRVQGFDFYPDGSGFSTERIRFYYLDRETGVEQPDGPALVTQLRPAAPNPAGAPVRSRSVMTPTTLPDIDSVQAAMAVPTRLPASQRLEHFSLPGTPSGWVMRSVCAAGWKPTRSLSKK